MNLRLAVGFYDNPEVRLYDGTTLESLPGPDLAGMDNGDLISVAWSADVGTLYAGGRYDDGGALLVLAWAAGGTGPQRARQNTVAILRPVLAGGLFVVTAEP